MKIAIVIPAYNEDGRIGQTLKSTSKCGLPVIVVDDGSKDDTYKLSLLKADFALRHKTNLGKGAAMKTGANFAFSKGFDAIVYFDADGQHFVEDIGKFISKLKDGDDIVFGTRNYSYGVPLVRYLGNKFASIFVSVLFGIYVSDLICGYRALNKKAFRKVLWESTGYGVETEMVIRTANSRLKHSEVPVKTVYHDKVKGVTILDALGILVQVIRWRLKI